MQFRNQFRPFGGLYNIIKKKKFKPAIKCNLKVMLINADIKINIAIDLSSILITKSIKGSVQKV
ncbi:hypothetical protein BpHYR1_021372 [Brachionus plicatilis]|uniref:Uncharacterized protein n=1 Tax=Brachionus plicatilis TaxID=10195 RepID=A0A3M7Q7N9_BRAPC|nr:hypothetical protein BpHYR1_021372 [Brachionus plicatilis]